MRYLLLCLLVGWAASVFADERGAARDAADQKEWSACIQILEGIYARGEKGDLRQLGLCYEESGQSTKALAAMLGAYVVERNDEAGNWLTSHWSPGQVENFNVFMRDNLLRFYLEAAGCLFAVSGGLLWCVASFLRQRRKIYMYSLSGMIFGLALYFASTFKRTPFIGIALEQLQISGDQGETTLPAGSVVKVAAMTDADAYLETFEGTGGRGPLLQLRVFPLEDYKL